MYRNTFWRERGIKTKSPTTERQPEANQHVYLMVFFFGKEKYFGSHYHITKDKEEESLEYDTPSPKIYGAVLTPYTGKWKEEWDGNS